MRTPDTRPAAGLTTRSSASSSATGPRTSISSSSFAGSLGIGAQSIPAMSSDFGVHEQLRVDLAAYGMAVTRDGIRIDPADMFLNVPEEAA